MRLFSLLLVAGICGGGTVSAQTQATPPTAAPAAAPAALGQMVNQLMSNPAMFQALQQVQGGTTQRPQAAQAGAQPFGTANLTDAQKIQMGQALQTIVNKHLAPQEQDALRAFQQSPEGQSIAKKLPGLLQEAAPVLMQMYFSQGFSTGQ